MRLELNGKRSSSKRTRHLNIRYFYITDQLDQGWLTVRHCPTEDMIGDFFTKPLQGQLFRKLCGLVMNCPVDIPPEYMSPRDPPREDTGVCWDATRPDGFATGRSDSRQANKEAEQPEDVRTTTSGDPEDVRTTTSGDHRQGTTSCHDEGRTEDRGNTRTEGRTVPRPTYGSLKASGQDGGRTEDRAKGQVEGRTIPPPTYERLKVSGPGRPVLKISGTDGPGNTNVPTVWRLLESHAKRVGSLYSFA